MDGLIMFFNGLITGTLPSKDLDTLKYTITVSADPAKLKIEDKKTHEVWKIEDFNDREVSLLALLSALEGL